MGHLVIGLGERLKARRLLALFRGGGHRLKAALAHDCDHPQRWYGAESASLCFCSKECVDDIFLHFNDLQQFGLRVLLRLIHALKHAHEVLLKHLLKFRAQLQITPAIMVQDVHQAFDDLLNRLCVEEVVIQLQLGQSLPYQVGQRLGPCTWTPEVPLPQSLERLPKLITE